MARYTGAVCRICRREGQKLFLKGERCYTGKCAISRRSYAPGQHGQGRKKLTEYGIQLRAKQKARRYYGVLEHQFAHYFELASKMKEGKTGENLLGIVESRLDNIVYRLGWASSRAEARQLVVHKHFRVNGKCVNIPSYSLKKGDVIEIKEKHKGGQRYKDILEVTEGRLVPAWLEANHENLSGSVVSVPTRDQIDVPVNEVLIVELYSK